MTESQEQLNELITQATPVLIIGLILFMVFIVFSLARQSKGGKMAYFVLSLALLLGTSGYVAKLVIQHFLKV
ncbi:MAG: hypothetical protein RL258_559 [Pseudomonadota bacterium]